MRGNLEGRIASLSLPHDQQYLSPHTLINRNSAIIKKNIKIMTTKIFHPTPRPPHHLQGLLIKVPGDGEVGERLELLDVRLEAI